jgi:hypothetical protein
MVKGVVPISVISLRVEGYTSDRSNVIISLTTKYSAAERKYSMPLECVYDFIVDLKRLNAIAQHALTETAIHTTAALNEGSDPTLAPDPLKRIRTSAD